MFNNAKNSRIFADDSADDEYSTDSSNSSSNRASICSECLSNCDNGKQFVKKYHYLERLRVVKRLTRSQDRNGVQKSWQETEWNLENVSNAHSDNDLPLRSNNSSEAHSSSESDSEKTSFTTAILRQALQNLKIMSPKNNGKKKEKNIKKILRSPVSYIYVCGPSGLPTRRVPKKTSMMSNIQRTYSCQDLIKIYR